MDTPIGVPHFLATQYLRTKGIQTSVPEWDRQFRLVCVHHAEAEVAKYLNEPDSDIEPDVSQQQAIKEVQETVDTFDVVRWHRVRLCLQLRVRARLA
jgi:hypothetical protein